MGKTQTKPSWRNAAVALLLVVLVGAVGYAQSAVDTTQQHQDLKWREDECKNYRKELKDIQRDVKNVDTSTATSLLDKCDQAINVARGFIGSDTFNDQLQIANDAREDVSDYIVDVLRPLQHCSQVGEGLKDRRKELKNLDRTIKDITKNDPNIDVSSLQTIRGDAEQLIVKCEQVIVSCTADTSADAGDCGRDVGDKFSEFYDVSNEAQQKANVAGQKKDLARSVKDWERTLKDVNRELKSVKDAALLTELQGIVSEAQNVQGQFKTCVESLTSEGEPQDCWDLSQRLNELIHEQDTGFWSRRQALRDVEDLARCQKDRTREHKDRVREVKDLRREEARLTKKLASDKVSELTSCINTFEEALKQAEALIPTDQCNEYWNVFNELEPFGENDQTPPGGCWDLMNRLNQASEVKRTVKDIQRQVKENQKECRRIEKEAKRTGNDASSVTALCTEFAQLADALTAANNADDTEQVFEIQEQINDFWGRWGEATQAYWERQQSFDYCRDTKNVSKEIAQGKKQLERLKKSGKISQELYETCTGFVSQGEGLISNIQNACESGDRDTLENDREELEFLGQTAQFKCSMLFEGGPVHVDYREYEGRFEDVSEADFQKFGERLGEEFRSKVFENVIGQIQEQVMKQLMEKILGTLEESLKARLTTTLENLSVTNPGASEEAVSSKLVAIDCASALKAKGGKAKEIASRIEGATLESEGASQLQLLCDSFLSGSIDVADLGESVDRVLGETSQRAVEKGITCFADVATDQWFNKDVCGVAQLGIGVIEGGKGGAEPTRNVNVAEVLKMTSRVLGEEPGRGCPKNVSCDQWYAPFVKWGEDRGLSLAKGKVEAGRPATRGEVVRAILEAAGVQCDAAVQGFADVSSSHPHAGCIAKAVELKIVSGTEKDGKKLFYPDRNVLRAEIARIMKNAYFALGQPEPDVMEGSYEVDDRYSRQVSPHRVDEDDEEFEDDFEDHDFDEDDEFKSSGPGS